MSRLQRIITRVGMLICLLLVVMPYGPFASAETGPFRITYQATPESNPPDTSAPTAVDTTVRLPAGPALDEGSSGPNVRARSDRAGSDTIPAAPTPTPSPTEDDAVPRLDEPVLRWLPEIMTSAEKWGVPPEILAGMIRIESQGEPGPISPSGARGLVQMMPDGLASYGAPEALWHDPATNIDAGAWGLAWRFTAQGSWEGAIGAYLGFGCDAWGTCTDVYIRAVLSWAVHYAPIIADPQASGLPILPEDWAYGPIRIFQVTLPPDLDTPTPTATPTATGTAPPTSTPKPGEPTAGPTEPKPDEPTVVSTDTPPTVDVPTEVAPTEAPPTINVPTEPPATQEPPPPPPTEEPPAPEPTAESG